MFIKKQRLLTLLLACVVLTISALRCMENDSAADELREQISILCCAVEAGDLESVKKLIKQAIKSGIDSNKNESFGIRFVNSLVCIATDSGQLAILQWLVSEYGISIAHTKGPVNRTLVHLAALAGHLPCLEWLILNGGDINARDLVGMQPIHCASMNIDDEDPLDTQLILRAALKKREPVVEWLIEQGADVNSRDQEGMTPLHIALQAGNISLSLLLINHGARINIIGSAGCHSMHYAAIGGCAPLLQILTEHRADIHAQDDTGVRPIHKAASYGRLSALEWLIEHGADVYAEDDFQHGIMHFAAAQNDISIFDFLAGFGVEINDKTSLTSAVEKGRLPLIRWLAEHGVAISPGESFKIRTNFSYTPKSGATVIEEAYEEELLRAIMLHDREQAERLIVELGSKEELSQKEKELFDKAFVLAVAQNRRSLFCFMCNDAKNCIDKNLLQKAFARAAFCGKFELVGTIYDNAADFLDSTWIPLLEEALMLAAVRGHTDIVKFILELSYKLDLRTDLWHVGNRLSGLMRRSLLPVLRRVEYRRILKYLGQSAEIRRMRSRLRALDGTAPSASMLARLPVELRNYISSFLTVLIHNQGDTPPAPFRREKYALLHQAVRFGRDYLVKELTWEGVDINTKAKVATKSGSVVRYSLLVLALRYEPELVPFFLDRGANLSVGKTNIDSGLLMSVVIGENMFEIAELLMQHGVNDFLGRTPLDFAFERNNRNMALLFLKRGCLLGKAPAGKEQIREILDCPLLAALAQGEIEEAKLVSQNASGINLDEAFVIAAARGERDIFSLLQHRVDISLLPAALVAAASGGSLDIFKMVYELRQDTEKGWKSELEVALVWAATRCHEDIVDFILEQAFLKKHNPALNLSRASRIIAARLRQSHLTESVREALSRILQRLVNVDRWRIALEKPLRESQENEVQFTALDFTTLLGLPADIITLILSFVMQPIRYNRS